MTTSDEPLRLWRPCHRCAGGGKVRDIFGDPTGATCARCNGAGHLATREANAHLSALEAERHTEPGGSV